MGFGISRTCAVLGLSVIAGACSQAPQPFICPEVSEGDLVITEMRGDQLGGDNLGQWIEIYNATDDTLDLRGLEIRFIDLQGDTVPEFEDGPILVRAPELLIKPGGYATFGHHRPMPLPQYIDYSFISDYNSDPSEAEGDTDEPPPDGFGPDAVINPKDLVDQGTLELLACGEVIDKLVYPALPRMGTWSFNGALEPSAEANDDSANFCVDSEPGEDPEPGTPVTDIGLPGTPQQENRPCP